MLPPLDLPEPPPLQADEKDVFKFFSQVGKVNDIQLITDKNTRRCVAAIPSDPSGSTQRSYA